MLRPCVNGCGWSAFESYATCCKQCNGADGPHTHDCGQKNKLVLVLCVCGCGRPAPGVGRKCCTKCRGLGGPHASDCAAGCTAAALEGVRKYRLKARRLSLEPLPVSCLSKCEQKFGKILKSEQPRLETFAILSAREANRTDLKSEQPRPENRSILSAREASENAARLARPQVFSAREKDVSVTLQKAENHARACEMQGFRPLSLDTASRSMVNQTASRGLLGSQRIISWCSAGLLSDQREVMLNEADVGEEAAIAIAKSLGEVVVTLNLAGNYIGCKGCAALGCTFLPNLQVLILDRNGLGDLAVESLCNSLATEYGTSLRRISLAQNQISRSGRALGKLLARQDELELIDIHWNFVKGDGAVGLIEGLEAHTAAGGHLGRLDISWNSLALDASDKFAATLSRVLEAECPLVHLDLSYNRLPPAACNTIAEGLKDNHTLLGLHLVGNSAGVDSKGFVVPAETLSPADQPLVAQRQQVGREGESAARHCLITASDYKAIESTFKSMDEDGSGCIEAEELERAMQSLGIETSNEDAKELIATEDINGDGVLDINEFTEFMKSLILQERQRKWRKWKRRQQDLDMRRERSGLEVRTSCWICESWKAVELTWRGPAKAVWAFTSLDNFQSGVSLAKTEQGPFITKRMFPPHQVAVILQVDGRAVLIPGVPSARLPEPISINLMRSEALEDDVREGLSIQVTDVSVFELGWQSTVEEVTCGTVHARCVVIDDPSSPGGFCVAPRVTEHEFRTQAKWTFPKSIFYPFRVVDARVQKAAFDTDWGMTKARKFLKEENELEDAATALREHYGDFLRLYYRCAASSTDATGVFSVSMKVCSELLSSNGIIDNGYCRLSDVDTMYIAARVRAGSRSFAVKGGDNLIRFQFLEFLLRVAIARYLKSCDVSCARQAVHELFGKLEPDISRESRGRAAFFEALHTEECDLVFKKEEVFLQNVYNSNSGKNSKPGEPPLMCCKEFYDVLQKGNAFSTAFPAREATYAFLLGKQLLADELFSLDFCQMTFLEFIHGLGAVAWLRRGSTSLVASLELVMESLSSGNLFTGMMRLMSKNSSGQARDASKQSSSSK